MDRIINVSVSGNYLKKDKKSAGVRGEANVTMLRITFDNGWDNYAKKVTFLDARGQNPVNVVLGINLLEDALKDERVYLVPIPAEPMAVSGELTFIIEGVFNDKIQKSFADTLEVKDSPDTTGASNAQDPTPSEIEQLRAEIEHIKNNTGGVIGGGGSLMTSVKTFGAVGDGKTDDTAALVAAARSGKAVFFPAGTYLLLGQIDMTVDINWYGEGAKSVIKLMPYDQSRPEEYDGRTVYNCYMINHPSSDAYRYSLNLQGLVLDANKEAYKEDVFGNGSSVHDHITCLDIHNPKSVYLHDVEIRNALIEGSYIHARGEYIQINISNCRFHDNGEYQVDGSGLHIEGDCRRTVITNCEFNSNGFHGLLLGGAYGANVSNISCYGNGFGGVALWGGASQNTLSGVYCSANYYGVLLKADYSSYRNDDYDNTWMLYAANNTIVGLTTVGNTYGIVFCNCEKTIISGWNCAKDSYAYYIGYVNADKDITGTVHALLDYTTAKEAHDIENTDRFKIKFIGE